MGDVIRGSFGGTGDIVSFEETGDPAIDFASPSVAAKGVQRRLFGMSRFRIHTVMAAGDKLAPRALATLVLNAINAIEVAAGSTFIRTTQDADPYLFEATSQRLIRIEPKETAFQQYAWARYGLNSRDAFTTMVLSNLKNFALTTGWVRDSRRFAAYNPSSSRLYLSRYAGSMWVLDGEEISAAANGKHVFFADDDGGRAWPDSQLPIVPPLGELAPADSRLLHILTDLNFVAEAPGGMTAADQKRALLAWVFACAFPDLMPTKPLLLLEGAQGSGKTTAIKIVQHLIHGRPRPMIVDKDKPDEFPVMLLRSMPIALLDNVDSYVPWLPDKIAFYATNGQFPKRKLYSDHNEVVIHPQSLVAIASKNPTSFRREDVADRMIILRLDRRDDFQDEGTLFAELEHDICALYGEWLYWLNLIVARLKQLGGRPHRSAILRMADFENLLVVVGHVLGWTEAEVASTIDGIRREQLVFAGETDPLPELLDRWLSDTKNVGRTVEVTELVQGLGLIAKALDRPHVRSATALIQKLRSPHLHALFDIRAVHKASGWCYAIRRRGGD